MILARPRTLVRAERTTAGEIRRSQERRLRALLRVAAARSPFYRRWFAESGVDPRSIRTFEDLGQLPLLDRRHLAEQPEDFLTYPRRLLWPAKSSGTSGQPLTVYRTPGSSAYELAVLERQWSWFGLPRGPRRAILRGSDFAAAKSGPVTRQVPGARQLLVSSFHLATENLPTILADLRSFRPHAIEGWPSSITLLAGLMRDAGERVAVDAIITSSEMMTPAQRTLMREVFAGPIVDHYGQTERVAMAGSCEHGSFHVFPDYGFTELLPVVDGTERWEIVGTPLHNWGFPLFRYRTGDEVGPAPRGPCNCGRAFPLLGPIDGRVEDTFTSSDGRHVPLPSAVLDDLSGVREVQLVQRAPGRFEVRIVPGAGFDRGVTEGQLRRNVAKLFGTRASVTVQTTDQLTRSPSGKLKPVLLLNDLLS